MNRKSRDSSGRSGKSLPMNNSRPGCASNPSGKYWPMIRIGSVGRRLISCLTNSDELSIPAIPRSRKIALNHYTSLCLNPSISDITVQVPALAPSILRASPAETRADANMQPKVEFHQINLYDCLYLRK
jgi:hypothetical protein